MRIELTNFKCHANLSLKFNTVVSLIKGVSGVGKTTLLNSISFVLYGKRVKLFNPGRVSITLHIEDMVITRQKKPDLLKIQIGDQEYEDDVAQAIINQRFGSVEVWSVSSLIVQNERCSFLTMSNDAKMDLLNAMAFGSESTDMYLDKIDTKLAELLESFGQFQGEYESRKNVLMTAFESKPFDVELAKLDLIQLELGMKNLESEISGTKLKLDEERVLRGKYSALNEALANVKDKLLTIPFVTEFDLDFMRQEIRVQQELVGKYGEYTKIKAELDRIGQLLVGIDLSVPTVTEQEYWQAVELEKQILVGKNKCLSLGCEYSVIGIQTLTERLKEEYKKAVEEEAREKDRINKLDQIRQSKKGLDSQIMALQSKLTITENKKRDVMSRSQMKLRDLEEWKKSNDLLIHRGNMQVDTLRKNVGDMEKRYNEYVEGINKINGDMTRGKGELELLKGQVGTMVRPAEVSYLTDITKEDSVIIDLNNQLGMLKLSLDILTCPCCNNPLKYTAGKLVKSDLAPATHEDISSVEMLLNEARNKKLKLQQMERDVSDLLKRWEHQVSDLNMRVSRWQVQLDELEKRGSFMVQEAGNVASAILREREELEKRISSLKADQDRTLVEYGERKSLIEKEYSGEMILLEEEYNRIVKSNEEEMAGIRVRMEELNQAERALSAGSFNSKSSLTIMNEMSRIAEIQVYDIKISSNELKKRIDGQKLAEERTRLDLKMAGYLEMASFEIDKTRVLMTDLEAKLRVGDLTLRNRLQLEAQLESIQAQILSLPKLTEDLDQTLANLEMEHVNLIEKIGSVKYHQQMLAEQDNLGILFNQAMEIYNSSLALQRLKDIAVKVEYDQLKSMVNRINEIMDEVFGSIFEDPISVQLNLFKVLKTDKRIKPQINLHIWYKNMEYDHINQLSGGEGDRVSLGLTIALNCVNNSPVLLLDECISSLDGGLREACIKVIRKFTTGKVVLCVLHEAVEGLFDTVINL